MTAEILYDLPADQYRARPGINASSIVRGRLSMLHMHAEMTRADDEPTPAMEFGTAAHYAILEGGSLTVCDARAGSRDHEAAIMEAGNPSHVVKGPAAAKIAAMRDRVMNDREAGQLIAGTRHEVSIFWKSDQCGACKARLDGMGARVVLDYKTTGSIDPRRFFRTAYDLGYHLKMGWYAEAFKRATGQSPVVYLIVQEKLSPYDVAVMHMPDPIWEKGREEALKIALTYRISERCGMFPGVSGGRVIDFELPPWAGGEVEEDVSDGTMEGSEL